jgi:hypothetical protein
VKDFFAILKSVSQNVTGTEAGINWTVSVRAGSNLVIAEGAPSAPSASVESVYLTVESFNEGMALLARGTTEAPRYFSEAALEYARDLALLGENGRKAGLIVEVGVNGHRVPIAAQALASVSKIQGKEYKAIGSIEGRLQTVSDRGKFHFVVYDSLRDRAVQCTFDEGLLSTAMTGFRKRVAVYGMVTYRENGTPVRVKVQRLQVFRDADDLPPPQRARGLFNRTA